MELAGVKWSAVTLPDVIAASDLGLRIALGGENLNLNLQDPLKWILGIPCQKNHLSQIFCPHLEWPSSTASATDNIRLCLGSYPGVPLFRHGDNHRNKSLYKGTEAHAGNATPIPRPTDH